MHGRLSGKIKERGREEVQEGKKEKRRKEEGGRESERERGERERGVRERGMREEEGGRHYKEKWPFVTSNIVGVTNTKSFMTPLSKLQKRE